MSEVNVTRAGFLATVQDLGRGGYRQKGVSLAGALDTNALRIANLLVGNDPRWRAWKATFGELRLRCNDRRLVAWCGGAFHVEAADATLSPGRVAVLENGDELTLKGPERGARAWLAIAGGIDVPVILGSRGTDLRAVFGGLEGRPLRDGDTLDLGPMSDRAARIAETLGVVRMGGWSAPNEWSNTVRSHVFLRVVRGEDWTRFRSTALASLSEKRSS